MTLKKITLATLISFTLFSCSLQEQTTETGTLTNNHPRITVDENFDEKMSLWFLAFNYYQEKGYDMETADRMAVEAVEKRAKPISLETLAVNSDTDLN